MTLPSLSLLADRLGFAAHLAGQFFVAFAVSFGPWVAIALIWSNAR